MVELESIFPGLIGQNYQVTSPATEDYNCIAWAAGDAGRWWWPDLLNQRYWPAGIPRSETILSFQEAFQTLGFAVCENSAVEPGFEKVALFADAALPLRAARQLHNGRWTSKLGELEDIEHDLHHLEGVEYGKVVLIMKRSISRQ